MLHRLAWITLCCLVLLIFVGAIVRVTGSGLGCPDWPTCWGCLIPPTQAQQIDVQKLDLEKFKRHAARHGIDPETITQDTILESFDPVHTWIEFINRLTSLPLGLAALMLALFSFAAKRHRRWMIFLSWVSLLDVIANAVMGAMVVRSGLKPGIITAHLALAFLLIIVLVSVIWLTRSQGGLAASTPVSNKSRLLWVSLIFFGCLFGEGILGSQVREQTDQLIKVTESADNDSGEKADRSVWIESLEKTLVYKIHRSFSWTLLATGLLIFVWSRKLTSISANEPKIILAIVLAMMIMGIIMAHIAVFQVVQVLHVGFTSILLAVTWHWILRLFSSQTSTETHSPAG